jgi:hypothetical protein
MKVLLLCLFFMLIVGCSSVPYEGGFNVSFSNPAHKTTADDDFSAIDKLSFVMQNNEEFALECNVVISMDNNSVTKSKEGYVGVLDPQESKLVAVNIKMPPGASSFDIKPNCRAK